MADHSPSGLVPYERERFERIKRNRLVLKELGLWDDNQPQAHALKDENGQKKARRNADAKAAKLEQPSVPVRRSRRLEGQEASDQLPERVPESRVRVLLPQQPRQDADAQDYHDLNNYRLATMSEEALRRRIWKIRKPNKLASFIKVLRGSDHEQLAAEAEEALQQLQGPIS